MSWFILKELICSSYESLGVLIVTAVSCALIGDFLVLRKLSMLSDAISHSVLLGIVLTFFIVQDVTSPWLIFGAALFGVITVFAVETLSKTGLVKNDDAVGIVFPLFFSVAVILITKYARNVHLDTDMVLMGEVIMAPLYRTTVLGLSLPHAFVQMVIILLLNLLFIIVFFKELKISTFDGGFATTIGFSSWLLYYALMGLSSLTAVVAFDAVGAILVVSFLIAPGACAYLFTKDLIQMLWVSVLYASVNSLTGYFLALYFQVSMSGMVATVAGCTFLLTFLFHRSGLITSLLLRKQRKNELYLEMMLMHIGNHMNHADEQAELGLTNIQKRLNWRPESLKKRSLELLKRDMIYIDREKKLYLLSEKGIKQYERIKAEHGT